MGANGPSEVRRPLEPWEEPHLQQFGEALHRHRTKAGISLRQLRLATGIGMSSLSFFERGRRRTRASTIRRIARALAESMGTATADDIAEELLELIGPALAAESPYVRSIERRRDRHVKKLAQDPNAILRPPPKERVQLERSLGRAERDLSALRRRWSDLERKEEELRLRGELLDRRERHVQARELQTWSRQEGGAERTA